MRYELIETQEKGRVCVLGVSHPHPDAVAWGEQGLSLLWGSWVWLGIRTTSYAVQRGLNQAQLCPVP